MFLVYIDMALHSDNNFNTFFKSWCLVIGSKTILKKKMNYYSMVLSYADTTLLV